MALNKVREFIGKPRPNMSLAIAVKAVVYRDTEWNEYRVRFYSVGPDARPVSMGPESDYFTTDMIDAFSTAQAWCLGTV